MKFNANAELDVACVKHFTILDLEKFFADYSVTLLNIKHQDNSKVRLSLRGTKDNLRYAVKSLYYKSSTKSKEQVPDSVKNYLNLLSSNLYQKNFDKVAEDYMKHCALHDQLPHPEVVEGFVY